MPLEKSLGKSQRLRPCKKQFLSLLNLLLSLRVDFIHSILPLEKAATHCSRARSHVQSSGTGADCSLARVLWNVAPKPPRYHFVSRLDLPSSVGNTYASPFSAFIAWGHLYWIAKLLGRYSSIVTERCVSRCCHFRPKASRQIQYRDAEDRVQNGPNRGRRNYYINPACHPEIMYLCSSDCRSGQSRTYEYKCEEG